MEIPKSQFSKSHVLDLLKNDKIEETKKYVKQYFYKCLDPLVTFYFNANTQRFLNFKQKEVKDSLLTTNFKTNDSKIKADHQFNVSKWFYQEDDTFYKIIYNTTEKTLFSKNGQNYVNLFSGFPDNYRPYDLYSEDVKNNVEVILNHLKYILCSRNEKMYEYVLNWISSVATGRKMTSLLHFLSEQGTGKSIFWEFLQDILTDNLIHVDDNPNILDGFNNLLKGKILLVLEELPSNNIGHWFSINEKIKTFTTSKNFVHKEKYKNDIVANNICSLVVITNNKSALRCGRRNCTVDISNEMIGNFKYFNKLYECMEFVNVKEAFLNYLRDYHSKHIKFNERIIPKSNTKNDLIIENMKPSIKYIKEHYLSKNKGLENMKFIELYDEIKYEIKGLSKIQLSKELKNININTSRKRRKGKLISFINVSYNDLLNIYRQKNWIHEIDDIDDIDTDENIKLPIKTIDAKDKIIENLKQTIVKLEKKVKKYKKRASKNRNIKEMNCDDIVKFFDV